MPTELAVQRDRGIDRDRRGADAALGPVEGEDPPERRPSHERLARGEAGEEALDPGEQLGRVEGLDEVVVGAGPQAADLLFHLALGGQHDDRDVGAGAFLGPDLRRHLVAVELRQHDVEEHEGGVIGAPHPEALRPVAGDDDVVALLAKRVREKPLDVRVVVDDEDLGRHQLRFTPV